METIVKHLGAGTVYKYNNQPAVYINISDLKSITNIIIPFFEKYPIYGCAEREI
jgi:LAGLIDADG endonuclease